MEVQRIQKKIRVTKNDLVKYQIIMELVFFKKEILISSDVDILTLLVRSGSIELNKFCSNASKILNPEAKPEEFSIRSQNIRNRIVKLEKRGFITKSKTGKKIISINKDLNFQHKGPILLDYNILSIES